MRIMRSFEAGTIMALRKHDNGIKKLDRVSKLQNHKASPKA